MNRPEKPKDEDCCGSGCTPCVFDVYESQLKKWQENKNSNISSTIQIFNQLKNTRFKLTDVQKITHDTNLYTFQAINENDDPIQEKINLKIGDYAVLRSPEVSRAYSIISNNFLNQGMFQVLVQILPNGKMGQFLSRTKINDILLWRGLYNNFNLKTTDKILLVGEGTGVVPLHNIAKELVKIDECDSMIKLILCFNSVDEILLRDEFSELGGYWNCKICYQILKNTGAVLRYRENVSYGLFTESVFKNLLQEFFDNVSVVICGTDSFNDMCKNVCRDLDVSDDFVHLP